MFNVFQSTTVIFIFHVQVTSSNCVLNLFGRALRLRTLFHILQTLLPVPSQAETPYPQPSAVTFSQNTKTKCYKHSQLSFPHL